MDNFKSTVLSSHYKMHFQLLKNVYLNFWPHWATRGILGPQTGMECVPLAVKVQSLNHWITREVPGVYIFTAFSLLDFTIAVL